MNEVDDLIERPDDVQWTYVNVGTGMEWPRAMSGYVRHRRDLSDLGEPYLSAVKEARRVRIEARGRA